jgi:hypothetical protein
MEIIEPYAITPWEDRLAATIEPDEDNAIAIANCIHGIRIATSSSERKGIGMGGIIHASQARPPVPGLLG